MRIWILFILASIIGLCSFMTQRVQGDCLNLPSVPYNYSNIVFPLDILNNIREMDNMPSNNPTTDEGATLGRVLFYDVELSKNRKISCASCHQQQFAFTDTARFSVGFDGELTHRNSMSLAHARFQKDSAFFWDNRALTLEIQTLMPIQSDVEMGLTLDTLVARVASKSYYAPLFQAAFGSPTVTSLKISRALAQFIRSMNTFGSKYRIGVNSTTGNPSNVPLVNLTAEENLGKDLFMDERRGNCQACHTRNIFVPQGSKNIGLDLVYADNGVGAAFNNPSKNGQFSVPSLINVALTAPYMHDGRYKTLEQVVNFYSDSIKQHRNLDGFLRASLPGTIDPNNNTCDTCPPRIIRYTDVEKRALVAFMKTLTDTILTTDARWSNPFCTSSANPQLEPLLGWGVYPSPLNRNTSLNIKVIAGQPFSLGLNVFASDGKLLLRQSHSIQNGSNFITVTNVFHSTGIYLIQLSREGKPIGSKQIVVTD